MPGPAIARPGSTTSRGVGGPTAAASARTIALSLSASSHRRRIILRHIRNTEAAAEVDGNGSARSCRHPNSATTSRSRPTPGGRRSRNRRRRRSADPMWLCGPTGAGCPSRTRRTASIAAPLASERPNFWSSCAVEMNSWVCASTPTVTDQHILDHARRTGDGVEPFDLGHRVQHHMSHTGFHGGGRLVDGLVVAVQSDPLRRESRRSSATASSPPLQTSSDRPSWSIQRAISCTEKPLDA